MTDLLPPTEARPSRVDALPVCFAFLCFDGPDAATRRGAAIVAHLRFMESVWRQVLVAGPLYDSRGGIVGNPGRDCCTRRGVGARRA